MTKSVPYPLGTTVKIVKGPLKGLSGRVLSRQGGILLFERKYILQFPQGGISGPIREKHLTGA